MSLHVRRGKGGKQLAVVMKKRPKTSQEPTTDLSRAELEALRTLREAERMRAEKLGTPIRPLRGNRYFRKLQGS
jgi:hypothetical protein